MARVRRDCNQFADPASLAVAEQTVGNLPKNGAHALEVLVTLLSERYERGSVMLTGNSKRKRISKDPMTTAAAIDRRVHHGIILELNIPSYRLEQSMRHIFEVGHNHAMSLRCLTVAQHDTSFRVSKRLPHAMSGSLFVQ